MMKKAGQSLKHEYWTTWGKVYNIYRVTFDTISRYANNRKVIDSEHSWSDKKSLVCLRTSVTVSAKIHEGLLEAIGFEVFKIYDDYYLLEFGDESD